MLSGLSRPPVALARSPVNDRLTPTRRAAMEIIRTAMQATAPVEGAEPIRVEIVEQDGYIVFETVWSAGEPEPVTEDDLPY